MKGAEYFIEILRAQGVRYLFGNPGHTELDTLDIVSGLPDMDYVLGLSEAVCLGMADGYAMASGQLGVFCAHCVGGVGNSIGMLYNASKTGAPLLIVGGQQDSAFSLTEPFLWGDIIAQAQPLTKWAYQVEQVGELEMAMQRAIKVASTPPMGPVCLSLPKDVMRQETEFKLSPPTTIARQSRADREAILKACDLLLQANEPILIAGDEVDKYGARAELQELAELLGCPVYSEVSSCTFNFSPEHPLYQGTLSRVQQAVRKVLDKADLLFAVGAELFRMAAYAPLSPMPPALPLIQLNVDPWQLGKNYPANLALWGDPKATLAEMVVEIRTRLDTTQHQRARQRRQLFGQLRAEALAALDQQCRRKEAGQPLCPNFAMRTLLEHAPDDAVIVDESNTTGINLRTFMYRRQLDYFAIKGGALGWGLPASIGVGLARPHQPVLALLGDGGAMYTIQGLWSAAHYRVKVVFVICNNTQYRIVKHRLHQSGGIASQVKNYPGVELQDPAIDFSSLARSMGLWATRVEDPDQIGPALQMALAQEGPALLDIWIEGSYPERES